MNKSEIIKWLLESDPSIQYQVHRDLLGNDWKDLQKKISKEGFGAKFLSERKENGNWGQKFYQPKWISTHYTILDLRNLCIDPNTAPIRDSIQIILEHEIADDGGILPIGENQLSDLCINGMFLNYASYFKTEEQYLVSVVDCILNQIMPDGGFNCRSNRYHSIHSSLHTTISVIEGITEYQKNGYNYKYDELEKARQSSIEFILKHQLYISDRTGDIISKGFLKLAYPCRWHYDVLRALDYFQYCDAEWDDRMSKAVDVVLDKRKSNGLWNAYAQYPGKLHFEMEKAGKPGRWNTLRAMRVLEHFQIDHKTQ